MLEGWLGFVESATLHWVEEQEVSIDDLCDLLVSVSVGLFQTLGTIASK